MLIEVHHLEAIELVGNFLDLLPFAWLDDLHTGGVPIAVSSCPGIALIITHHLI